jgi:hypothetical protein
LNIFLKKTVKNSDILEAVLYWSLQRSSAMPESDATLFKALHTNFLNVEGRFLVSKIPTSRCDGLMRER